MKVKTDFGYNKMSSLLMTPPEDNKIYRLSAEKKTQLYIILV